MELKEARAIARRVGATIEPRVEANTFDQPTEYIVRLGVCRIGSNGTREDIRLHSPTPGDAAHLAVIETAKACRALGEVAKAVYVDTDLIFQSRTVG